LDDECEFLRDLTWELVVVGCVKIGASSGMGSSVPELDILGGHEFDRSDAVSVSSSPRINFAGPGSLHGGARRTSCCCWTVGYGLSSIPESYRFWKHGLKTKQDVDPDFVSSSPFSGEGVVDVKGSSKAPFKGCAHRQGEKEKENSM